MRGILTQLPNIEKRVLTSATQGVKIPNFVNLHQPVIIDFLDAKVPSKLVIKTVVSPTPDKEQTLIDLLLHIGHKQGIVFCNLRDSIENVSEALRKKRISHSCFSGGIEQKDRERALITFRNGTSQVLLATDLAARGIDIPELNFIVHYELPYAVEEFTHRNGRTARVNAKGTAYILKGSNEQLPEFIEKDKAIDISKKVPFKPQFWETLFISGGRKDKISKGDIAGLFFKQGGLNKDQLGAIELKQDCAFVAVPKSMADNLVSTLNNSRLKKKKVRIYVL
ncbi:helicase-related protein [Formosa algae]|uniref:helicase-related protein n=1 Tax=Formosa algae TaxID=225843 RepID=UPI00374231C0